jgi:hypothetical protein
VGYYECSSCGSLQTQEPTWLAAAYGDDSLPELDTYTGERVLMNRMLIYFLFKACGLCHSRDKLLDWGAGHGLLVRMLRDVGIDAYGYDKYEMNRFASTFEWRAEERYTMLTSFEVWEHFADPKSELDHIFGLQPEYALISTCEYHGQNEEWDYLGPAKSQHIFFYSRVAMKLIAARYGYQAVRFRPEYTFFYRKSVSRLRLAAVGFLMAHTRLAEIVFAVKRKWSLAAQDHQRVRKLVT